MKLRDLIILERFLQEVPTDLSVWLKERKPKSGKEAAQMADDYSLARGTKPSYEKLHRPQRLQSEPATNLMEEKQQSSKLFFSELFPQNYAIYRLEAKRILKVRKSVTIVRNVDTLQ